MKILKKALISIISLTMLSGCGDSNKREEAVLNDEGNIVVRIGQQIQPNSKFPEGDSYEENAYRRLIEEKLGAKIETAFEANGDDYERQVSLAIASGELPDIMTVSINELVELAENDLIEDLSQVYEENASNRIKEIYKSFDNVQLEAAKVDGKLMGLPGVVNDFGPNLIWIRQDWVDNLNIDIDSDGNKVINLKELEQVAQEFIDKDPGKSGKMQGLAFANWLSSDSHGGSAFTANAILNSFGAYPKIYLNKDNEIVYGSNTDEMKEGLSYLNDLFERGLLDQQFGTRTFDDITAMMINNEIGILTGPWHLSDWNLVQGRTTNKEANWVPYAIENEQGKVSGVQKPGVGSFVVVRKGFSNPELAVKIINLIYDEVPNSENLKDEFPEMYEYAKQSVDGSARPMNIELFNNLSEITDAVESVKAAKGEISIDEVSSFVIKNNAEKIQNYLEKEIESDPTDWAVYASRLLALNNVMNGVREAGIYEEVSPVVYFKTLEASERNGAQISKLEEETFIKFITGEESLENFDIYKNNWNSQGGEEILKEMKEAVSE